jgi:hypothetical protein
METGFKQFNPTKTMLIAFLVMLLGLPGCDSSDKDVSALDLTEGDLFRKNASVQSYTQEGQQCFIIEFGDSARRFEIIDANNDGISSIGDNVFEIQTDKEGKTTSTPIDPKDFLVLVQESTDAHFADPVTRNNGCMEF